MTDALRYLLPLVDTESGLVGNHHAGRWPEGVLDRLMELGLLDTTHLASQIQCPECGQHTEEVLTYPDESGPVRFYIQCPETWRVEILHDHRRQWHVNVPKLLELTAKRMDLKGDPKELLAGRLWRMGRTSWNGANRDVVFARGLAWPDSQQIRSAISRCTKPIVVTSRQQKSKTPWRNAPISLALDQIATLTEDLSLDVDEIIATLNRGDPQSEAPAGQIPSTADLKLLVRRQIKAEQKTELTDAVLVQAFLQEGSFRKAAEFLTGQTGQQVSKDKVQRAVNRSGGIASLLDGQDSNSIVRGVASQHRDSRGNILIKETPMN